MEQVLGSHLGTSLGTAGACACACLRSGRLRLAAGHGVGTLLQVPLYFSLSLSEEINESTFKKCQTLQESYHEGINARAVSWWRGNGGQARASRSVSVQMGLLSARSRARRRRRGGGSHGNLWASGGLSFSRRCRFVPRTEAKAEPIGAKIGDSSCRKKKQLSDRFYILRETDHRLRSKKGKGPRSSCRGRF